MRISISCYSPLVNTLATVRFTRRSVLMRLFYAALALEANTFLPVPTSYQAFLDKLYYPPGKHPEKAGHQTGAIAAARAAAKRDGFELIEGSCYPAQPGGAASRAA